MQKLSFVPHDQKRESSRKTAVQMLRAAVLTSLRAMAEPTSHCPEGVVFYSLGKCSYNMLGKRFGQNRSLIDRWIRETGLLTEEPSINGEIKEIEFDEMWHLIDSKKHWLIKAVDRRRRKTLAWVLGGRDRATFRRLYDKVKHLENCMFYTDHWNAFAEVLPAERHVIGKSGTFTIEQNSNTRHHLGRFTRRTKIVSKSNDRVDLTIRLWCVLTTPEVFSAWQAKFASIYK
jgi:insertion element IS1 protein InsB